VPCDSPLPHGRGSKRACRVWGACRALRFPPPSRSGLQKSVSCLAVLVVSGDSPSLTVGAPKELVVSEKLVVPCDSPLPYGRGSKRACRVLRACRVWGFPPPLRSGLQKSLSCPGCVSCLGVPRSLTVGAPKELVVSGVRVVSGGSPLPHGRGSKRACRVQGACRVWGFPPPSRSGLQKSVSCLAVLVVSGGSPLPHGRGSKRACRVWGACRVLRFPPPSRSGLQKSVSCLGSLSCLAIPPLPHGRGSKRACRVLGVCRALAIPPLPHGRGSKRAWRV
jgi:hypothetical protein